MAGKRLTTDRATHPLFLSLSVFLLPSIQKVTFIRMWRLLALSGPDHD